jgi:hypothetical protein
LLQALADPSALEQGPLGFPISFAAFLSPVEHLFAESQGEVGIVSGQQETTQKEARKPASARLRNVRAKNL